jgi:tRNA(Ile)-lysidine synthase
MFDLRFEMVTLAQANLKTEKMKLQPLSKLERKLRATLRRLGLDAGSAVLIGVSGGADSMALLDAMIRLREQGKWRGKIYGAHVNHLLRGAEADADAEFVGSWALSRGVIVAGTEVDVAAEARATGQNLEAVARQVRYDFFRWFARGCAVPLVFTAHTFDDQVETLLMRWLRGTGAEGLRGIHELSELCEGVRLVRPLLEVTREEVLEHCAGYGVAFRTDSSNLTNEFTRNRVRHELLPLLHSFNPRFGEALLRGVEAWLADADCLDQQAAEFLPPVCSNGLLQTSALSFLHPALRLRVLRAWLRQGRGGWQQITAAHWQALERLISQSQSGRRVELPGGWWVVREFDCLRLLKVAEAALPESTPVPLLPRIPVSFCDYEFFLQRNLPSVEATQALAKWPAGWAALLCEGVALETLQLRARQPGDAYIPRGRQRAIKLKNLLIRRKIPQTERAAYPLIVTAAGQIVWAPKLPVAAAFVPGQADKKCALVAVRKL